jgi:hypothetical protein
MRYANNSNYKNDDMITREVFVSAAVLDEVKRIVEDSEVRAMWVCCMQCNVMRWWWWVVALSFGEEGRMLRVLQTRLNAPVGSRACGTVLTYRLWAGLTLLAPTQPKARHVRIQCLWLRRRL